MEVVRTSRSSSFSSFSSSSIQLPFFLVSLFVLYAQALVITPSLSLTASTNLSDDPWSYRQCVSDPTWNPPRQYIASSCENALVRLSDDMSVWGKHPGTFTYRPGARSTASFPGVPHSLTLPKRYVHEDCVVAIVMMKMFEHSSIGQFPGLPDSIIGKWRSRDTSTWRAMIEPIEYVRATCGNGCGFAVLGREFGIGVAIWSAASKWDRYARDIASLGDAGEVMPVLEIANTSLPRVGNRSVAEAL